MNIEQLNGSGQHLWVFILTAVITLVVTGGSWFIIEQVNSYPWWRKRRSDTPYNGETQFSLVVRLALLVYLVSNGHSQWMLKSGAWWRIIIDHRSLVKDGCVLQKDNGRLTAGEYVSKYSTREYDGPAFFDDSNVNQWIDGKDD